MVEKIIKIAVSSWVRHVLFNSHQFQPFECLYKTAYLTLYISLFHYALLKLLNDNNLSLRIVILFYSNRTARATVKKTRQSYKHYRPLLRIIIVQETRDHTRPGSLSLSLSLFLAPTDRKKRCPGDKVGSLFAYKLA